MDGDAVPQLMPARRVACAVGAAHPGIRTQASEGLWDELDRHGGAATHDKDRVPRAVRVPGCVALREGGRQHLLQGRPTGDLARLVACGVPHGQQGLGHVDIPERQGGRFAHAYASAIQAQDNRVQCVRRTLTRVLPVRRGARQEAVECVARVHLGDARGRRRGHGGGPRRLGAAAAADRLVIETAQHAILTVPVPRHGARPSHEGGDVIGAHRLAVALWAQLPATRFHDPRGAGTGLPQRLSHGHVWRAQVLQLQSTSPRAQWATCRSRPRSTLAYTRVVSI